MQRCIFVEGIGRVHALGPVGDMRVAVMDHGTLLTGSARQQFDLAMLAADIIAGDAPGRIVWSVRFKENEASK
jgi:hypothetical protein